MRKKDDAKPKKHELDMADHIPRGVPSPEFIGNGTSSTVDHQHRNDKQGEDYSPDNTVAKKVLRKKSNHYIVIVLIVSIIL